MDQWIEASHLHLLGTSIFPPTPTITPIAILVEPPSIIQFELSAVSFQLAAGGRRPARAVVDCPFLYRAWSCRCRGFGWVPFRPMQASCADEQRDYSLSLQSETKISPSSTDFTAPPLANEYFSNRSSHRVSLTDRFLSFRDRINLGSAFRYPKDRVTYGTALIKSNSLKREAPSICRPLCVRRD